MGLTAARVVVIGSRIVQHARDRVLEGAWETGLEILMSSLDGMREDHAFAILRGDKTLTDQNGDVRLLEESDAEYKTQLAALVQDVCRIGDRYWRPYGMVMTFGGSDLTAELVADHKATPTGLTRSEITRRRAIRYRRNETDQIIVLNIQAFNSEAMATLWAPADIPPPWTTVSRDPQQVIDAFYARGETLEDFGYERKYGSAGVVSLNPAVGPGLGTVLNAKDRALLERFLAPPPKTDRQTLAGYRQRILEQAEAAGGFLDLDYHDGHKLVALRVPRAPFEKWPLHRTAGAHLATPWKPVCPQGLKQFGDDVYHTDWMIGAGLEVTAMFVDRGLREAMHDHQQRMQEEMLGFEVNVLAGAGRASGKIVHPRPGAEIELEPGAILVLPNLDPRYLDLALSAGAIIAEQGGEMAHLAQVGRERGIRIVRVPDARRIYPAGIDVTVDCSAGKITIEPGPMRQLTMTSEQAPDEDEPSPSP